MNELIQASQFFFIMFLELVIVTISQYFIFGSKRLDKSLAFLAVVQLFYSSIELKEYYNMESVFYAEMYRCFVTLATYSTAAWYAEIFQDLYEGLNIVKKKKSGINLISDGIWEGGQSCNITKTKDCWKVVFVKGIYDSNPDAFDKIIEKYFLESTFTENLIVISATGLEKKNGDSTTRTGR